MRTYRDDDRGQVAVEFLGMVPLILLTLALLWQVVLVGYTYTLAGNAADEAARAAAVGDDCQEAGLRHVDGAWRDGAEVSCPPGDGMVTAVVSLQVPALVPGVGGLFRVDGKAAAVDEKGATP
ncbi:TadE/TadG family type IV pilus assembly protein [Streptomyces vietnamensis]|uniref:Septum formation initiator n=1 Tax=Streptomyces vietnamensis TaxID=362257 RepID=A0A0B5HYN5_9ACTN|nr:TadE/TadG family type IV pilus assembly protein [Streptomyces vietnamensis]AJF67040.1 septum formation initiator [Streptomyces vietnamensis]